MDFSPQDKKGHKGDYHKFFNSKNFLLWFKKQLLANLHQPSLIILDNAKYHKTYDSFVPKSYKMKKQDCINYLKRRGEKLKGG